MAVSKRTKNLITQMIIKGIQRNGERIFNISQDTATCFVPVDTGNLKRSGSVEPLSNGVRIIYRAPYASEVEVGIPNDIPITGKQIVTIRTYTRKGYTRKDGVYVPATVISEHKVVYENKRLIRIRPKMSKFQYGKPEFRVISKIRAREGQFYLTRAVSLGLENLADDIKFYLQRLGRVD